MGVLIAGGLAAGIATLALSTRTVTIPSRWHGALLGTCVGVFGLCMFGIGALWNERSRVVCAAQEKRNGVAPHDAKFWLRKFLEEQQRKS